MIEFREDIRVDLVQHYGSDEMVAMAARVSTGKDQIEGQKIEGLINYLVKARHNSPLEHSGATFRIEAPMFVRDQWVRHRTQQYNVKSLRFSEATPEFYVAPLDRPLRNAGSGAHPNLVHGSNEQYLEYERKVVCSYHNSWQTYTDLISEGIAEEIARSVLPAGLYTYFYATANLWNWIHFLGKRVPSENNKPQHEIVVGANQVKNELTKHFPITMKAAEKWLLTS